MNPSRPNGRLLKPNFNISKRIEVQEDGFQIPDLQKEVVARPIQNQPFKPFRPPSSLKEDPQRVSIDSQPISQPQSQPRRTPLNNMKRFNPLAAPTPFQKPQDDPLQTEYMGPKINIYENKEKLEKQQQEVIQQEMRQKTQVKTNIKPLVQFHDSNPQPTSTEQKGSTIKVAEILQRGDALSQPQAEELQKAPIPTRKVARKPGKNPENTNQDAEQPVLKEQKPQSKPEARPSQKLNLSAKPSESTLQDASNQQSTQNAFLREQATENQQAQTIKVADIINDYKEKALPKFNISNQVASKGKQEIQRQRVIDLKRLIELDFDEYSNQLVIQPQTPFEGYLNLIKAGVLKNSCDQAFDDKKTQEIQVETLQTNDFNNQCPEDYNRTFVTGITKTSNNRLARFLEYACEVIEEMLPIDQEGELFQVAMLDKVSVPRSIHQKLKFVPIDQSGHFYQDGSKLSFYQVIYVESEKCSLIVTQKTIYHTNGQVTIVSSHGDLLVAGTSDGHIVGWSLRAKQVTESRQTKRLSELLAIAVAGVSFSSEWNNQVLDFLSDNQQFSGAIQSLRFGEALSSMYELYAMDVFGQIVLWQIYEMRYDEADRSFVELGVRQTYKLHWSNQIQKPSPKHYTSFRLHQDKQATSILTCGPNKVVNITNFKQYYDFTQFQPTYISQIIPSQQGYFFYVGYAEGSIKLFYSELSNPIMQIRYSLKPIMFVEPINGKCLVFIDKECAYKMVDVATEQLISHEEHHNQIFNQAFFDGSLLWIIVREGTEIITLTRQAESDKLDSQALEQKLLEYEGF